MNGVLNRFIILYSQYEVSFFNAHRMTSVQVQVNVLDANDNGPVISKNGSTSIKIEEEQEAGVLIYVVVVRKDDHFRRQTTDVLSCSLYKI